MSNGVLMKELIQIEKEEKPKMITTSSLKERGWTQSLINKFLSQPDLLKINPYYKCAAPMKLYKLDRITCVEESKEFKCQTIIVAKRKESSLKAIKTKLDKMKNYLNAININLPQLSKEELLKRACFHYNNMQQQREINGLSHSEIPATKNSDTSFLDRICVNYLRHCLTSYEKELDAIYGKVGFIDGYLEIRDKIFEEIAKKYTWLLEECKRQNGNLI
jgi:hypothetical protein